MSYGDDAPIAKEVLVDLAGGGRFGGSFLPCFILALFVRPDLVPDFGCWAESHLGTRTYIAHCTRYNFHFFVSSLSERITLNTISALDLDRHG